MHSVLITGAGGNLGGKLVEAFAAAPWCERIVAVDRPAALAERFAGMAKVRPVALDLVSADDAALAAAIRAADTLVHFAVVNPLPDASWEEAAQSFAMTARLLMLARDAGLRRFVFASSSHTVGKLKDQADGFAPGSLGVERVAPGTRWETLHGFVDGHAYGAAKAFGERACVAAAQVEGLTTVSIRIGWCQSGENRPQTLNAGGNPQLTAGHAPSRSGESELRWFRNMWLSNRDFVALFERAVLADAAAWPHPGIVLNGMSANAGMAWDIEPTCRLIGYRPQDDVWASLRAVP